MKLKFGLLSAIAAGAAILGATANAVPTLAWAQTATGTTLDGGDYAVASGTDASGNVYVVGNKLDGVAPNDFYNIVVIKYNSAGVAQWTRTYDRNGFDDIAIDAKVDSAGNVYVTGYSSLDATRTNTDVLILKVTTANVVAFANTYVPAAPDVDEYAYSIAVDGGGNAYIAGEAGGTAIGAGFPYDAALYRVNSAGVFQWRRTYVGSLGDYDTFNEVAIAPNGDAIACGYLVNTDADALTVRVTTANVEVFQNLYNTTYSGGTAINQNVAGHLAIDGAGNAYVVGTNYKDTSPVDRQETFLRKFSSAGAVQWTSIYDGDATGITTANDVVVDAAGTGYVVGETTVGGVTEANANQYIRRVTTAGVQSHVTTRDGGFGDFYNSVGISSSGNVYASGWSNLDAAAVVLNKDGVIVEYLPANIAQNSFATYNGAGNDWDLWLAMSVSGNDLVVCGYTYSTFTDANLLVAKYATSAFYNPDNFTVVNGTYFGGTIASLVSSDNNKVVVFLDEFDQNSNVDFTSVAPTSTPTLFRLHCETSSTRNDLSFFTRVFNYSTNSFVNIDFRTSSITDVAYIATATGNLAQLVGPANVVRSRHSSFPNADLEAADGWIVAFDRWQWEIQ